MSLPSVQPFMIFILGIITLGFVMTLPVAASVDEPSPAITINESCTPFMVTDPEFDFELKRALTPMYSKGADLGEVIGTAARMKPMNFETWYNEWTKTADHFNEVGKVAKEKGHLVSAHDAWLRAATYYRTAEFFLHSNPDDPRILTSWRNSVETFRNAMDLDPVHMEVVTIPYENTTLPGYFYTADDSGEKKPLLIVQTGFDGTQEELYSNALEGVRRGYNVLTFEGPGQGEVIRVQKLPFRYDWEYVVTPVIDYAVNRTDVDPEKIGLWGISMGGYLAPRAAAFDDRITALIADGGIYDLAAEEIEQFKQGSPELENVTREEFFSYIRESRDEIMGGLYSMMNKSTSMDWEMTQGMYVFGVADPVDVMLAYEDYTLADVIDRITATTLVADSVSDSKIGGTQPKIFYDHLTSPKEYMVFNNEYCAGEHCQIGASALSFQQKFDWLDEQLHP